MAVRCFLVGRSLYRFVRNEGIKECSVTLRPMKKNWFLVEMAAVDEECPAALERKRNWSEEIQMAVATVAAFFHP